MNAPNRLASRQTQLELDIARWYLFEQRQSPRSSVVEMEHFTNTDLQLAWQRVRKGDDWTIHDLGLGDGTDGTLLRVISDHNGPVVDRMLHRSENALVNEWSKRQLGTMAEQLLERMASDPTLDLTEAIDHVREAISAAEAGAFRRAISAQRIRQDVVKSTFDNWGSEPGSERTIPIGIGPIREAGVAFFRGTLNIVGAPTGGHKTTFGSNCADYTGRFPQFPTLFVPLEDGPRDIEARSIVREHDTLTTMDLWGSPFDKDGNRKQHSEAEVSQLIASADHAPKHLRYVNYGRMTLSKLIGVIRSEYPRGLAFVVVDHLHRLKQDRDENPWTFWERVGNELADLARELDIAILGMAQLDKDSGTAAAAGKYPTINGLRYGGALTNPARSAWMINIVQPPKKRGEGEQQDNRQRALWEAYDDNLRVLRVTCEKNTKGKKGMWLIKCNPAHDRIVGEVGS